jgi:hypothetical protein
MSKNLKSKDITPCKCCGKGLAKGGPAVYRVRLDQYILDPNGIERAHGEQAMMGPLAQVLGTDPDIAVHVSGGAIMVCGECILSLPGGLLTALESRDEGEG